MKVQLSKRLETIAHCVTKGSRVADIGCDHAHTSMYMLQENIAVSVIAMDVNRGPLEKAAENIRKYGMEGRIELRLSDGARKLQKGEVDSIVISGMGGPLTIRILQDSHDIIAEMKELVLQPQSEIPEVRKYLHQIGFYIRKEEMLWEDNKPYVVIVAERCAVVRKKIFYEKEIFYRYGKYLLEEKNKALYQFLTVQKEKYEKILCSLRQKNSSQERAKEIQQELSYMDEALEYYKKAD